MSRGCDDGREGGRVPRAASRLRGALRFRAALLDEVRGARAVRAVRMRGTGVRVTTRVVVAGGAAIDALRSLGLAREADPSLGNHTVGPRINGDLPGHHTS
jgi:hypothetical protein